MSQHGLGLQKINKTRSAINISCSHDHGTEFTAEKKNYDIFINFKHTECDELGDALRTKSVCSRIINI